MNRHIRNTILLVCLFVTIIVVTFSYAAYSTELIITGDAIIEGTGRKKLSTYISNLSNTREDVEEVGNAVRFVGSDPNNYVYYNGELWRIVGVFDTQTANGTEKLTKLIRTSPVESLSYNGGWYNNGNGTNDFSTSRVFNYLYENFYYKSYNNYSSYTCYNGTGYNTSFSCGYKGLSINAASMVEKVYYNLGSTNPYEIGRQNVFTPAFLMQSENSSATPKVCSYSWIAARRCNDQENRPSTVLGYVGLPYPSDLGYAAGTVCSENTLGNSCYTDNWMNISGGEWTISPAYSRNYADTVVSYTNGSLGSEAAGVAKQVRPVLYLKNEVLYNGGTGTQADPFLLIYNGPIGIDVNNNYAPQGESPADPGEIVQPDDSNIYATHDITSAWWWNGHYYIDITIVNESDTPLNEWTVTVKFKDNVTINTNNTLFYPASQGKLTNNTIKMNSINQWNSSETYPIEAGGSLDLSSLGTIIAALNFTNGEPADLNSIIESITIVPYAENLS